MGKLLTKSNYLIGLKCPRSLWITKNKKELLPEIDISMQHIFDNGYKIEELAKKYFKGGIEVPQKDFNLSLNLSKQYLEKREILFEPAFKFERCYSRADVLKPVEDDLWDLIEIKSATKVKEINLADVAFQKYVYSSLGIKIRNCYLMHINNLYIKKNDDDINLENFFILEDITNKIKPYGISIKENIDLMLKNIDSKNYNEEEFPKHCINPKECPLPQFDWNFLPKNSVFNLYNIRVKKSIEYLKLGIINSYQLKDDFTLTPNQKIQINCELNNEIHIDDVGIKSFLDTLKYPLYFIDFETYNPPIPKYEKMRAYQRIPFQFSLHIQSDENSKLEHVEFLSKSKEDPRRDFIESIKKNCGDFGSIITYNKSFEIGVLNEIVEFLPEYKNWFEEIKPRIVDLLDVFKKFYYYNPKQMGSCSIKKVLPAIYPNKNYEDLEITNGINASVFYENSIWKLKNKDEIDEIHNNLLKYCSLDTIAMFHIKEELEKLI